MMMVFDSKGRALPASSNSDNNTLAYSQSTVGQNLTSQHSIDQMTDHMPPQGQAPFQNITNQPQLHKNYHHRRDSSGSLKQVAKNSIQTRQQINVQKLDNTCDLVVINEDDSGSISIDRRRTKGNRTGAQDVSVENVETSDSDLTDLDDLQDDEKIETEGSISLQVETESERTRIVHDRSNQLSKEKKLSTMGISSGKTGKTAWQASAEQAIQEEEQNMSMHSNDQGDSVGGLSCSEKQITQRGVSTVRTSES